MLAILFCPELLPLFLLLRLITEIVVGAKVDLGRGLAILASDADGAVLGRDNDTLRLVRASSFDSVDLLSKDLGEVVLGLVQRTGR